MDGDDVLQKHHQKFLLSTMRILQLVHKKQKCLKSDVSGAAKYVKHNSAIS